jgi:cytochrome P450 family 6
LVALEGQEWRERRVKLSPIFTSGKMKMMFEIVNSLGDKLSEVISKNVEKEASLEMREYAGRFTADVIGKEF